MQHDYQLSGYAFRLRPVEVADAEFIVELRTADAEHVRYVHPVSPDVDAQRRWLAQLYERFGDYYWVLERQATGAPEGLVAIYDVDESKLAAEWGRWVLKPGSLGAVECALLVYRAGFELLRLEKMYCITAAANQKVLSFHDACGLPRVEVIEGKFHYPLGTFDGVVHACDRTMYTQMAARLEPHAQWLQRHLQAAIPCI